MKLAYSDSAATTATRALPTSQCAGCCRKTTRASGRRRSIRAKANCAVAAGTPVFGETTYLTTVDKDGNIASWIQSLYDYFGSGVTVEGMGFLLHDRGSEFHAHAAAVRTCWPAASGLRTRSFRASWKRAISISGSASWADPIRRMAHAQFVSNVVDYGMNVQQAVEAARFRKNGAPDAMFASRAECRPQ